jgi:hypothetical protein
MQFCCEDCLGELWRRRHRSRRRAIEQLRASLRPASGESCASGVLAPALSEPKARSRAPARRLCDGVRRSRPTPCRQPEHRSHQTRSAAAASFARCIIEDSYYRQSGGAGSGARPTKRGANCKDRRERFGLVMVQVRRTPVVPVTRPIVCRSDLGSSLLGAFECRFAI